MAGAGPAADAAGNIYVLDGNGTFDTTLDGAGFPSQRRLRQRVHQAGHRRRGLSVADYFATFDTVSAVERRQRPRLWRRASSSRTLSMPAGATRHLAVGAGKDGHIYVVDRDAMGKWNASTNQIYQDISRALGGSVFSMPAYFNNTVYYGASGGNAQSVRHRRVRECRRPRRRRSAFFRLPGNDAGVSASGITNGIVWAVENTNPAVLHAYDATNLARSCTTPRRRRTVATHSAPATSSSRRRSSTAGCTSARRPAWRCSVC